jgi:parallel beta-helix repeat protein
MRNPVFAVVVLFCSVSTVFAVNITDPGGLDSDVNSSVRTIAQEVGNYSIAQFNGNSETIVFTIETGDGFGPSGDHLWSVILTDYVTRVELKAAFDPPRDGDGVMVGWGRVMAVGDSQWNTSGVGSVAYASTGSAKITFDHCVYGVGFTVNRLQAPMTVKLWASDGVQIGSDYTIAANSGSTNHSFFGYYNDSSSEIETIEFGLGGFGNQFSIDDIVIIPERERPPVDVSNVTGSVIDEEDITHVLHVSKTGNDSNSGTEVAPLLTINEAADRAGQDQQNNEGTKIIIHPGTYRETVDALLSYPADETITAPIIFEADEAGSVIISGSDVYTGWVPEGTSDVYTHIWLYNWGLHVDPPEGGEQYAKDVFLNNPILRRKEMFFVDGVLLTQVLTYGEMVALEGSFYVEDNPTSGLAYIHLSAGANVAEKTVEAAIRYYTFRSVDNRNIVLRGLIFEHSPNVIFDDSSVHFERAVNVFIADCEMRWCNGKGWAFTGSIDDSGPYTVYNPCEKITVRWTRSNYNGIGGFETNYIRNVVFEDNETSYNNWRGAMGTLVGWGWTGSIPYNIHDAIVRRHRSVGSPARGLWFDTGAHNVLLEDSYLCGNADGLKFEVCHGPVLVKNCVISDNTLSGILFHVSNDIRIEGCTIENNDLYQINVSTGQSERYLGDWEGERPSGYLYPGNLKFSGNVFGGSGSGEFIYTPGTLYFLETLFSDENYWYHSDSADVFNIVGTSYNFAGWQVAAGVDLNSVYATSAPVPSFCGDFGTIYQRGDVDRNCEIDLQDAARITSLWLEDSCAVPAISRREDVNHDCCINLKDFAILSELWLYDELQ